jgi:propanediol utilization protein
MPEQLGLKELSLKLSVMHRHIETKKEEYQDRYVSYRICYEKQLIVPGSTRCETRKAT